MVTALIIGGVTAMADTKTAATAPSGASGAGDSVATAEPLAEWKNWPDSDIHPDQGVVFGLAVDRNTGDLFVVRKPAGKFYGGNCEIDKSTDQARTFSKSKNNIEGAVVSSYAFSFDPTGKKMAFFFVYGGGGMSSDGAVNWTPFVQIKPRDFDCGAVDWEDTGKTCLAMTHEDKGLLVLSNDCGATWKELGTGYTCPVGIFDAKTFLACKDHDLLRSTDGGNTWVKVADAPTAYIETIVTFKGVGYAVTRQGLLASKDKGATWAPYGKPVHISGTEPLKWPGFLPNGPFFGADEKHIVLVSMDGVFQTADGAEHWTKVAATPEKTSIYAWDPVHNIVYACGRGSPPVCCQLPAMHESATTRK